MLKINGKKRVHFWKKFLQEKGHKLHFDDHGIDQTTDRFPDFWKYYSDQEKIDIVKNSKKLKFIQYYF